MTNEKRLSIICEMLREFDRQTGNKHAGEVIGNPQNWKNPDSFATTENFYQNAAALLIETMETIDKKTSNDRTILAALNRIIKRNKKECSESICGVLETYDDDGEKRYIVTDGCLAIRLNNDYTSLPRATNPPPLERVNGFFRGVSFDETLNLPTIPELKTHLAANQIKRGKKTTCLPYCFGNSIFVDAENLLIALQSLPDCIAYKPQNSGFFPIYFEASNGDGLLMPVNSEWAERQYSVAAEA